MAGRCIPRALAYTVLTPSSVRSAPLASAAIASSPSTATQTRRRRRSMAEQLQTLTLARPDDWHHHLRDGAALATTVPFAARTYGRAICMPNLVPPVTTAALAVAYKERIMKHVPKGSSFEPLMTLYLTDSTTPQDIKDAKASGVVVACKLYPKGATTNPTAA